MRSRTRAGTRTKESTKVRKAKGKKNGDFYHKEYSQSKENIREIPNVSGKKQGGAGK